MCTHDWTSTKNNSLRNPRTFTVEENVKERVCYECARDLVSRFEVVTQRVHNFNYLLVLGEHAVVVDQPLLGAFAGSLYCLHE